jgi:molecular chaperone HtpG
VKKDRKIESVLSEDDQKKVEELFKGQVKDAMANVNVKAMSPEAFPVVITKSEFMRRYKEMTAMQGAGGNAFPDSYTVVVNSNHPLVADKLINAENEEQKTAIAEHLYQLALLNQNMLKGSELTGFIKKSLDFLK